MQSGVPVFAARLLHEQLLARGLVLVQHALPRVDHPGGDRMGGGEKKGEPGGRVIYGVCTQSNLIK